MFVSYAPWLLMNIEVLQESLDALIRENAQVRRELRSVKRTVCDLRRAVWETRHSEHIPDLDRTIDDDSIFVKEWSVQEFIAEGASGQVFNSKHNKGYSGVIKKIPKKNIGTTAKYNSLNNEISYLKKFSGSQYSPSFYDSFQSIKNMYIVMENVGTDLHTYA